MTLFWLYLFWISLLVILIPYFFYPLLLLFLEKLTKNQALPLLADEDLPKVDILFAAYNEEAVLNEKLQSLANLDYPKEKLTIRVGSDASSDKTNDILKEWHARTSVFSLTYSDVDPGKVRF